MNTGLNSHDVPNSVNHQMKRHVGIDPCSSN
jgi:hypothetical protein